MKYWYFENREELIYFKESIFCEIDMHSKIRVLYICVDASLGGSTSSLYNMIDGLRDVVEPIVLFPVKGIGYDYFVAHNIESYIYPFVRLHEYKANKLRRVWRCPWKWHYINKSMDDWGCLWYVRKILSGRKVDIVHSNTSPNDIGVLLSKKLRAKHVWHVREFLDLHFHWEIYGGIPRLRKLINNADARIAISTAIKNHWQMLDDKTWVINNAVRKQSEACYIPEKEKYLLFSSYYLSEAKGARVAIIAFAKSGMAQQGYRLMLMGNCEEKYYISLMGTIREYHIEGAVDFVPCQKDVKPYFSNATAYIMSSEFEGLGRVTGEAMFFGSPVIAHATGGTLDLVKDGETGYLYNTEDECAQRIRKVCTENQEPLILRAQEFAINNLSQEVYGPKIMEVYNKILN